MLRITTFNGSIYMVDRDNKKICRTTTTDNSGESVRVSADWRPYQEISPIEVGEQVVIVWGNETQLLEGSPEWATPTTFTSIVAKVEEYQVH